MNYSVHLCKSFYVEVDVGRGFKTKFYFHGSSSFNLVL